MAASGLKPSDLHAFNLAAAGHAGVLSDDSGALVVKPCTEREVSFYSTAAEHPSFKKWMPLFYGTLELSSPQVDGASAPQPPENNRTASIVLQNLTFGFQKPCVMDVKLGAQLWDEQAPQSKRDRLDAVSNATTSRSLGMRVAGMRVWKGENAGGYKVYDKHYGRTFTADNCIEELKEYFGSDITEDQKKLLAGRFLGSVREIRAVLESQESRMFAASLLFVYEGDGEALGQALKEEEENSKKPPKVDDDDDDDGDDDKVVKRVEELKLIDFAHASWTPGQGPDENSLKGVRSTEKLLAELAG